MYKEHRDTVAGGVRERSRSQRAMPAIQKRRYLLVAVKVHRTLPLFASLSAGPRLLYV